jgi:hypothetical protein
MNRQHMAPNLGSESYGSEAHKLSDQCSGFERSARKDESFVKTAISLTDAETYRDRPHIGGFSGRRLLLGCKLRHANTL